VYVTVDELVAILGPNADPDRVELAAKAVSDWIDARTGRAWGDADPFAGPVPDRVHQLALNGAMRLYHGPEAPYGIVGAASDIPMRVGSIMVALDADALLLGLRRDFGIA
jgi:hypothetical protein